MFLKFPKHVKSGQAMIEFVMVIIVIVLLVSVVYEFIPIFTASLRQQTEAHSNISGITMLDVDEGIIKQQSDDFETDLNIPFLLQDGDIQFAETIEFPAANLKSYFNGRIDIPGTMPGPELTNENDTQTSMFKSWIISGAPEIVKSNVYSLLDSEWVLYENIKYENANEHEYVYVFTRGNQLSPSAVAAIYIGPAETCPDRNNPTVTTVTVIARTAGAAQ